MTNDADEFGYDQIDMTECDICEAPLEEMREAEILPEANFGGNEVGTEETIETIAGTLELSDVDADQQLADALREQRGIAVHRDCLERISLDI